MGREQKSAKTFDSYLVFSHSNQREILVGSLNAV